MFFIEDKTFINSDTHNYLKGDNRENLVDLCFEKILELFSTYIENGSNWTFKEVNSLDINKTE